MACYFSKFSCPIIKVASTLPTAGMVGGLGAGVMHAHTLNRERGGGMATRAGRYLGYGGAGGIGGRIAGHAAGFGARFGVAKYLL